jgi:hypothetical protein
MVIVDSDAVFANAIVSDMAAFQLMRVNMSTLKSLFLGFIGDNVMNASALAAVEMGMHAGICVVSLEGAATSHPLYHPLCLQYAEVAIHSAQAEVGKGRPHPFIQPEGVGMRLRGLQEFEHVLSLFGVSYRLVSINHLATPLLIIVINKLAPINSFVNIDFSLIFFNSLKGPV